MKIRFINIRIADGTGREPFPGELLTEHDRIAEVGSAVSHTGKDTVIDGGGKILAPGWIDAHGHSDLSLLAAPEATGKIAQGITTEVSGNCGLSPFPLTDCNREHLQELYQNYGIALNWTDGASYRARLPQNTLRLVPLCGHNTLRAAVAGYETRKLSAVQLDTMRRMLAAELDAGAAGLSSGLLYTPGCFADQDEIVKLLESVAEKNKIYALHLRSEGNQLLESLEATSDAALAAGLKRLQISHFKTAGAANWQKLPAALDWFRKTRAAGIQVWCDRYPWCESQTQLSVILPEEFGIMDDTTLRRKLESPEARAELERLFRLSGRDWSKARLVWTSIQEYQADAGCKFPEIAQRHGKTQEAVAVQLLSRDAAGCTAAFSGMSENNLKTILSQNFCACGTDESVRPADYRIGRSHPRGFGSMPRFFRMLRERGFPVGEAVRRMTGLPAEIFQLHDRGILEPGRLADLVLFDPEKFASQADFAHPHAIPDGVAGVWIGGNRIR